MGVVCWQLNVVNIDHYGGYLTAHVRALVTQVYCDSFTYNTLGTDWFVCKRAQRTSTCLHIVLVVSMIQQYSLYGAKNSPFQMTTTSKALRRAAVFYIVNEFDVAMVVLELVVRLCFLTTTSSVTWHDDPTESDVTVAYWAAWQGVMARRKKQTRCLLCLIGLLGHGHSHRVHHGYHHQRHRHCRWLCCRNTSE
jgi:hypothetical protein